MLVVFHGTDTTAVRTTALQYCVTKEEAGMMLYRIEAETYESGQLTDALGANSLFGEPVLYLLDTPSTQAEFEEAVLSDVQALAAAAATFVVIEGALSATNKRIYAKHAAICEETKAPPKERDNPFALAEALAQRDKKTLWLLLQTARTQGSTDEELVGLLWWQLKALRLAACTASAAEAGMSDFPYNKAKRALRNFKPGELDVLATTLLSLYHDGHGGVCDLALGLETWVLQV